MFPTPRVHTPAPAHRDTLLPTDCTEVLPDGLVAALRFDRGPGPGCVVSLWIGYARAQLAELDTDRSDTPTPSTRGVCGVLVDEPHQRFSGRSISAKKAEAARLSHELFFMCVHWFAA